MIFDLELWYLAPVAVVIATISMASGIGGAVFFAPLFMLVLKLDTEVAVGAALLTELFGFSSGLFAYVRRGLIDYRLGAGILMFAVPGAVVGTVSADLLPGDILKAIFGVGIIFIGTQLYTSYRQEQKERLDGEIADESAAEHTSRVIARDGTVYHYTVCEKNQGRFFAAIGGAFVGMISVGLAELQEYQLVARCRVPSPVAVGTSIFAVVITVLVASAGHMFRFVTAADGEVLRQVFSVVLFTIPGVLIGGQIGPAVQARVDPDYMKVGISFLFVGVGAFMLYSLMGV